MLNAHEMYLSIYAINFYCQKKSTINAADVLCNSAIFSV